MSRRIQLIRRRQAVRQDQAEPAAELPPVPVWDELVGMETADLVKLAQAHGVAWEGRERLKMASDLHKLDQ